MQCFKSDIGHLTEYYLNKTHFGLSKAITMNRSEAAKKCRLTLLCINEYFNVRFLGLNEIINSTYSENDYKK